MDKKISTIVSELKKHIEKKYTLHEMRIFGSTARGDSTLESDIDVFVYLPEVNRVIEEDLFDIAYELELKYDCVIDLIVFGEKSNGRIDSNQLPIYKNILKDGIIL